MWAPRHSFFLHLIFPENNSPSGTPTPDTQFSFFGMLPVPSLQSGALFPEACLRAHAFGCYIETSMWRVLFLLLLHRGRANGYDVDALPKVRPLAHGIGSGFGWLAWAGLRQGWLGVWLAGSVAPWLSGLVIFSACRVDPAGGRAASMQRRTS